MRKLLMILLTLTLTACATSRGFDKGSLRSELSSQKQVTDEDIKKVFALKPQLPSPFKVGIYFSSQTGYQRSGYWSWTGEDKDKLLEVAKELKAKNMISDMFVISDSLLEGGSDNKAIRLAAARAGADAVLVVNAVSDTDEYNNPLGATYFLLVTPFFVPGSVVDGLFMVNATLWDVRNQYLYLSAEAEGAASETRPAFFTERARVIKSAKATAMTALAQELSKLFNRMNTK
jgi:rhombotail lipoprotein